MRLRVRRLSIALVEIVLWFVLLPLFVWLATPRVWLAGLALLAVCWLLAELFWPVTVRWFRGSSPWRDVMLFVAVACMRLAESDLVAEAARQPLHGLGNGLFGVVLLLMIWQNRRRPSAEASGPRTV